MKHDIAVKGSITSADGAPMMAYGVQVQFSHAFWAEKFRDFVVENLDEFIVTEMVEKGETVKFFMNMNESGFLSEKERKKFKVEFT